MDINTKLEDDTVLFGKFENVKSKAKTIQVLHTLNINTVNDLMTFDYDNFYDKSKKVYTAIAYIFRHEYLGEELPFNDILDRKYKFSDNLAQIAKDLHTLGVVRDVKNALIYLSLCMANYTKSTVSMEYVLENYYAPRKDIARYYTKYIKKQNYLKQEQARQVLHDRNLEKLNRLQIEIETLNQVFSDLNYAININPSPALINFRTTIEVQLKDKQNQLNALNGKEYTRNKVNNN